MQVKSRRPFPSVIDTKIASSVRLSSSLLCKEGRGEVEVEVRLVRAVGLWTCASTPPDLPLQRGGNDKKTHTGLILSLLFCQNEFANVSYYG